MVVPSNGSHSVNQGDGHRRGKILGALILGAALVAIASSGDHETFVRVGAAVPVDDPCGHHHGHHGHHRRGR